MAGTPATQGTIVIPPPPPRMTGDVEHDVQTVIFWLNQFYQYAFLQNELLTAASQSQAGTFDPSTLPAPGSATVASAQNTANNAYILANAAKVEADSLTRRIIASGSLTISGAALSPAAPIALPAAEPDTNYQVVMSGSAFTGAPPTAALVLDTITKTVTTFNPVVASAPGVGNTVSFDYFVMRNS